jgi:hypothetical protein
MSENTIIKSEYPKMCCGNTVIHTFRDGTIILSFGIGSDVGVNIHLKTQDAKLIRDALDRGIAEYEAGIDHYHDICDEPPVPEEAQ